MAGAAVDTGVPSSRSMTTSRGIAITGGQPFGVAYLLDGAMHNNVYDNFNLPLPFPDAMQEFRVETSSQNAQSGLHGGGTVSVVTKSGTNLLHGDVFEFARHHRFNATSPFAGIDPGDRRTPERRPRAQPVRRNARRPDCERPAVLLRRVSGNARHADAGRHRHVRADRRHAGGRLHAGRLGGVRRAREHHAALAVRRQPHRSGAVQPGGCAGRAGAAADDRPVRPDHVFASDQARAKGRRSARSTGRSRQNHSLFGRYLQTTTFWEPSYTNTGNILATTLGGRDSAVHSLAVGDTMVLSNTMVNNVRFSVNRTDVHRTHAEFFGPEDIGVNSPTATSPITC